MSQEMKILRLDPDDENDVLRLELQDVVVMPSAMVWSSLEDTDGTPQSPGPLRITSSGEGSEPQRPKMDRLGRGVGRDLPPAERAAILDAGWLLFDRSAGDDHRFGVERDDDDPRATPISSVYRLENSDRLFWATEWLIAALAEPGERLEKEARVELLTRVSRHPKVMDYEEVVPAPARHIHDCVALRIVSGADPFELADELQASRKNPKEARAGSEGRSTPKSVRREGFLWFVQPVLNENIGSRSSAAIVPFDFQYHLDLLRCNEAWKLLAEAGLGAGNGVRVAVIDHGFDLAHRDLAPAVHPASGYFFDRWFGFPGFRYAMNGHRRLPHGTACAGTVLARPYVPPGLGIAFDADLIAISTAPPRAAPQQANQLILALAIFQAVWPRDFPPDSDADIILCSLGPNGVDRFPFSGYLLKVALSIARAVGKPVFWAVANGVASTDVDEVVSHPAVTGIAQTNSRGLPVDSAAGDGVAFVAPGSSLRCAHPGDGFEPSTGTSNAAACAAGVAALMLGAHPDLSRDELLGRLRLSAAKPRDLRGRHPRFGYGRIDALRAVEEAMKP